MQPLIHYHYPNKLNLVLTLSELPGTGYAMIYSRLMKINKGVTNQYRFTIQNQDQKPVNLLSKTLQFDMIDRETGNLVLTRFITDGSALGQCTLTLLDSDSINLDIKYYSYNISFLDETLSKFPLYTGFNYETSAYVEIVDGNFGGFVSSQIITTFEPFVGSTSYVDGYTSVYTSGSLDAHPTSNGNIALHTVAIYGTTYTGGFQMVGSLANDVMPTVNTYFPITLYGQNEPIITLENFTGVRYYNFYGIFRRLQVLYMPDQDLNDGTFDKVLYRY